MIGEGHQGFEDSKRWVIQSALWVIGEESHHGFENGRWWVTGNTLWAIAEESSQVGRGR